VTLCGAIIAAVLSGISLIFTIWPELKPDPKTKVGGRLEILKVDEAVTKTQYNERIGEKSEQRADNSNDPQGTVFYVRTTIEGFKRHSLTLKWYVYDKRGLQRTNDSKTLDDLFRPGAPLDTQIAQVWVKNPEKPKGVDHIEVFIRFELYAHDNVLLAFADSRAITIG
jgi:hypothetical protein